MRNTILALPQPSICLESILSARRGERWGVVGNPSRSRVLPRSACCVCSDFVQKRKLNPVLYSRLFWLRLPLSSPRPEMKIGWKRVR